MFLRRALLFFVGLCSGGLAAAGTFAFIVMIGVITRFADRTHTSKYIKSYETAIVIGGTVGNLLFMYGFSVPLYNAGLVVFGLFTGIFVGCLAMALAEVLKVFPILVDRLGLVYGLPFIVSAIALGKFTGALVQFMKGWA